MNVEYIAAFSVGAQGGNPAGVVLMDQPFSTSAMQDIARKVGYSAVIFAIKDKDNLWRTRCFTPEVEVPFCGHATIALGAVLGKTYGADTYRLRLNDYEISVDSFRDGESYAAAFYSPPTQVSDRFNDAICSEICDLFGACKNDINFEIWPSFVSAGANHLVLALKSRQGLTDMIYDIDEGRMFMQKLDIISILLVWPENNQTFHARSAFAAAHIREEPATGATAAAFAGYLRHINWPHNNQIKIIQGEDMGSRSIIDVELSDVPNSPVIVSGSTYIIER